MRQSLAWRHPFKICGRKIEHGGFNFQSLRVLYYRFSLQQWHTLSPRKRLQSLARALSSRRTVVTHERNRRRTNARIISLRSCRARDSIAA